MTASATRITHCYTINSRETPKEAYREVYTILQLAPPASPSNLHIYAALIRKEISDQKIHNLVMAEKAACGLVQYIALRGDLLRVDKWPIGAMVAQACHASAAVLHQFKDDSNTQQYLKDLDSMHKVVLEVSNNITSNKAVTCHETFA